MATKKNNDVKKEKVVKKVEVPEKPQAKVQPQVKIQQQPEKPWQFNADTSRPHDALLNAILIIAKLHQRPTSVEAVTAGLPLEKNKLTTDTFKRAAMRAGFCANLVKGKLNDVIKKPLPAVVFLRQGKVCILNGINKQNGMLQIIRPEVDEKIQEIPLPELAKAYIGYAFAVEPIHHLDTGEEMVIKPEHKPKHWLWDVLRKAVPIYNEILIASLLINIFTIASPLFVMNVYDRVVPNNAIETMWVLAIGVIIVFGFDFILRNLRAYFIDSAGKKIDLKISGNSFEQLLGLQMAARPGSTGALTNVVHSFDFFRDFLASASVSLIVDIPFALLFIAVIGMLGGSIALVPIIIIPIVLAVNLLSQMSFNDYAQKSHQYASEKQEVLIESLAGAETIKSMRAEGIMQSKWENVNKTLATIGIKMRTMANLGVNSSVYAQHMAVVCVVIVGVYKIAAGDLTIGALIACVILTGRALAPISQAAILLTKYKNAKTSLQSMDSVMNLPVERPAEKTFLHMPKVKGSVVFKNVDFNYPEQLVPALNKASFNINPGEKIGIIGRIGSGKSTIQKLILKLYQASSGTILIDGTEIQQLDPAELRHHIGYIPQDVVLFHGTIRDNIVIGAPHVDDAAVIKAAKLGGVDVFVSKDPEGMERKVFERGQNLSGGQRQAIAIARALLLNPSILVLDEPCNSMDELSVKNFVNQFAPQFKGKTLILSTHKSSLLALVDRLIVMDDGRIMLDGPKEQVIQKLAALKTTIAPAAVKPEINVKGSVK